jgi:hypothetical protein
VSRWGWCFSSASQSALTRVIRLTFGFGYKNSRVDAIRFSKFRVEELLQEKPCHLVEKPLKKSIKV